MGLTCSGAAALLLRETDQTSFHETFGGLRPKGPQEGEHPAGSPSCQSSAEVFKHKDARLMEPRNIYV